MSSIILFSVTEAGALNQPDVVHTAMQHGTSTHMTFLIYVMTFVVGSTMMAAVG